jgi:hypothetical protein
MKVRMLTGFGTADRSYRAGEEVDLDKDEAKSLLEAGFAEPIGKAPAKKASTRKAASSKSED